MPPAHILQVQTPQATREYALADLAPNKPAVSIGRAPDNDIVLPDPQVSGHHAQISLAGDHAQFVDLGSSNGTFVNGARLAPHSPVALHPGDSVQLGQCRLSLRPPAAADTPTILPSTHPAAQPGPVPTHVYGVLQVHMAAGGYDEYPIFMPEMGLGRSGDNDVILHDQQVSGHHLRLIIRPDGGVTAMDLGSLNGSRLNGQPMLARTAYPMPAGCTVQVADFAFSVRFPAATSPAPPPITGPDGVATRVRLSAAAQPALAVYAQGGLAKHSLEKATTEIGSAPECDIVIPVAGVAAHHARIMSTPEGYTIQDLGSPAGVVIGGRRVQAHALRDGDVIGLGQHATLQFRAHLGFVPAPSAPSATRPTPLTLGTPRAITTQNQDTITVGRAPDNAIVIDNPQVSRYHALIERLGTRRRIKDLKSANGVYVNGKRIEREAWLNEGDEISIGPIKLHLVAEGVRQVSQESAHIDAIGLNKWVSKAKNLLQDISISIQPQEFVAIVGLSGAGKSTFLDAVNGFRPATHGAVYVNGTNLYQNPDMFRSDIGYVPQKDIVHTDLTVHKALDYAAQLRMPADTSQEERRQRIQQVLQDLDLTERQDLPISRLSGGQLKRVSIGVELLTKPRLFFLDEPTSGLDPGTEFHMMRLLRKLADQGQTILLITHATKNVMMCDKVVILVRGGRLAFFGPPEEALTYFDRYRTDYERRIKDMEFDDIYTILEDETRGSPEEWDKRYRASPAHQRYVVERQQDLASGAESSQAARAAPSTRSSAGSLRQFAILTRRYLDLVARDRLLLGVLIAVMPIIGLLLVLISGRNWLVGDPASEIEAKLAADLAAGKTSATYAVATNTQTLLFMLALAAVLLGLFAAAYEIVKERAIYRRERMVAVRILPYLASKFVVLSAFTFVQCLLLLLVVSLRVRIPIAGAVLPAPMEMYLTLVGATLAAVMMGLFISALVPNTNSVIYVVLLALFFQIIFAGVLFDLPGVTSHLSALTITRWGMEGLGATVNMEKLNDLTRTRFQPDPITKQVSVDVSQPDPNWKPVTVHTVTQQIEVPIQPGLTRTLEISVPQVTENKLITVSKTMTQNVTVQPEPVSVATQQNFMIDYAPTWSHLVRDWIVLGAYVVVFGIATVVALRRGDKD